MIDAEQTDSDIDIIEESDDENEISPEDYETVIEYLDDYKPSYKIDNLKYEQIIREKRGLNEEDVVVEYWFNILKSIQDKNSSKSIIVEEDEGEEEEQEEEKDVEAEEVGDDDIDPKQYGVVKRLYIDNNLKFKQGLSRKLTDLLRVELKGKVSPYWKKIILKFIENKAKEFEAANDTDNNSVNTELSDNSSVNTNNSIETLSSGGDSNTSITKEKKNTKKNKKKKKKESKTKSTKKDDELGQLDTEDEEWRKKNNPKGKPVDLTDREIDAINNKKKETFEQIYNIVSRKQDRGETPSSMSINKTNELKEVFKNDKTVYTGKRGRRNNETKAIRQLRYAFVYGTGAIGGGSEAVYDLMIRNPPPGTKIDDLVNNLDKKINPQTKSTKKTNQDKVDKSEKTKVSEEKVEQPKKIEVSAQDLKNEIKAYTELVQFIYDNQDDTSKHKEIRDKVKNINDPIKKAGRKKEVIYFIRDLKKDPPLNYSKLLTKEKFNNLIKSEQKDLEHEEQIPALRVYSDEEDDDTDEVVIKNRNNNKKNNKISNSDEEEINDVDESNEYELPEDYHELPGQGTPKNDDDEGEGDDTDVNEESSSQAETRKAAEDLSILSLIPETRSVKNIEYSVIPNLLALKSHQTSDRVPFIVFIMLLL